MPVALLFAALVSLASATSYHGEFDDTDQEVLLVFSLTLGLIFAVSVIFSGTMLYFARGSVAKVSMWLTPCSGLGAVCMLWTTRILLIVVPVGLLIGWAFATGFGVSPALIGTHGGCSIGFVFFWAIGMMLWCLNDYRLTLGIKFGFVLSGLLLVAALLFVIFDHVGGFEHRACTATFLTMNMMVICKLHFDWTSSVEDFQAYCHTFETHTDRFLGSRPDSAPLPQSPATC